LKSTDVLIIGGPAAGLSAADMVNIMALAIQQGLMAEELAFMQQLSPY